MQRILDLVVVGGLVAFLLGSKSYLIHRWVEFSQLIG